MKPILYRRSSRWPLALAFVSATAIHVSGLAFSPARPAEIGGSEVPVITDGFDPPPDPPAPEPEDEPAVAMTPPPASVDDFPQEPQPTPRLSKWKKARPIHADAPPVLAKSASGSGKAFAINAPRPDYPYDARAHHITGSGIVSLEVNSSSGEVLTASITQSTGSTLLDQSALRAFRRWKFRSGIPSTVRIPVTFTMFGAQL
jgi:protein TonB